MEMNNRTVQSALFLLLGLMVARTGLGQCYQLGTTIGQLSPVLKNPIAFCPTPASAGAVCDCPTGYVAIGYEGIEGNVYGGMVLSQFKLRCKQLNTDGTLGATVVVTCSNGTSTLGTPDGPIDAAAGQALVGAEVRIGCATDAVIGRSKLLSEVLAGLPNTTNNTMTNIGGTGGSPQTPMYAPNGSVFVGMQTYVEVGASPAGAAGITAGVAWRYAPIINVPCATCSINSISVSNISACNNQGTPGQGDDTFTANVTVTFANAPTTGTLNITGDGTASVAVGSLGAGTYTFTGVTMSADGTPINLTATFSATPACTLNNTNAGTAPASCSVVPVCSVNGITVSNISSCNNNGTPANAADDTFTANVTVTFANPPATGTLNLSGSGSGSVAVGSLGAGTYTFNNVTMSANGLPLQFTASFSATSCTLTNFNAGSAPSSCSTSAPTIPTLSEWGLILFALVIFTLSVVFGTQRQRAMATGNAGNLAAPSGRLPFDKNSYLRVLPKTYLAIASLFAAALALGYSPEWADIPGALLTGAVAAYLVHFVLGKRED